MPATPAIPFKSHIDLEQNQIINVVIDSGSSFPVSPISGQMFYKTSSIVGMYYYKVDHWALFDQVEVDNVTLEEYDNAGIRTFRVKDLGISTGKLANDAVTTIKITDKNVTLAKIQDITSMTLIGRVTAGTGIPELVTIINDNDLVGASGSNLVTAGAVKAYIDSKLSGIGNLVGGFAAGTTDFPVAPGGTSIGDMWYVTGTSGETHGIKLRGGDMLIALQDDASPTDTSHWNVVEGNKDVATSSILGIVMLASSGDVAVNTMTEASKVITPAILQERTATESRIGLSAVATQVEVDAGEDHTKFVTPLTLKNKLDAQSNFTALIGGAATIPVTHNLDTVNVIVSVYQVSSNKQVQVDTVITDADTVTINFSASVAASSYRIVIDK